MCALAHDPVELMPNLFCITVIKIAVNMIIHFSGLHVFPVFHTEIPKKSNQFQA
jgi:hypothetical protein